MRDRQKNKRAPIVRRPICISPRDSRDNGSIEIFRYLEKFFPDASPVVNYWTESYDFRETNLKGEGTPVI